MRGHLSENGGKVIMAHSNKKLFYASLFLSGAPVQRAWFNKVLEPFDLDNQLLEYAASFNALELGFKIRAVAGGFQMVADDETAAILKDYFGEKPDGLSKSALETLSIIAYRQPLTKAEVEQVRGVDCSGSMKTLIDRGLIVASGRRQTPGRPLLYVTTSRFLEHFGLQDIAELPTFREWQELKKGLE